MDCETSAATEPLPWIVGVPKPPYADDPWFARFCSVAAQIMMEHTCEHNDDGQTATAACAGVE